MYNFLVTRLELLISSFQSIDIIQSSFSFFSEANFLFIDSYFSTRFSNSILVISNSSLSSISSSEESLFVISFRTEVG